MGKSENSGYLAHLSQRLIGELIVYQRYIKSRDLNLLFIIDIFSHYDRRIGQSGADR